MREEDCVHSLLKRVIDRLGDMTTNPATGVTEAPVLASHHECVECHARFTLHRIEGTA